jgi:hypothetical protein
MDKWIFLLMTVVVAFVTLKTYLWFLSMQDAPLEEKERAFSYSALEKSLADRKLNSKLFADHQFVRSMIFLLVILIILIVTTYRAFFP